MKEMSDKELLSQLELKRQRKLDELRTLEMAIVAMGGDAVLPAETSSPKARPVRAARVAAVRATRKPKTKKDRKAKAKDSKVKSATTKRASKPTRKARGATWKERISAALADLGQGTVNEITDALHAKSPAVARERIKRGVSLTTSAMGKRGELGVTKNGKINTYRLPK